MTRQKNNKIDVTGHYEFDIIRLKDNGWHIANGKMPGGTLVTQGRNEEEIFVMVADAFMAAMGVKVSWWNKFLALLTIYRPRK